MASQYYQSLIIVDSDHQLFPFPTVGPCVGNFGIRKPLPYHSMLRAFYYTSWTNEPFERFLLSLGKMRWSRWINNMINVVCMSYGDLLIWLNPEFWSANICYCLLSALQNQLNTEKKRVWLVNHFGLRLFFSVKKREINIHTSKFEISSKMTQINRTSLMHDPL